MQERNKQKIKNNNEEKSKHENYLLSFDPLTPSKLVTNSVQIHIAPGGLVEKCVGPEN